MKPEKELKTLKKEYEPSANLYFISKELGITSSTGTEEEQTIQ